MRGVKREALRLLKARRWEAMSLMYRLLKEAIRESEDAEELLERVYELTCYHCGRYLDEEACRSCVAGRILELAEGLMEGEGG